jgi:hypothetical protein
MTFPPPRICQRMRALHALIGSSNANEADSSRQKLNKLLAEYGLNWNDLPSILAAIDSNTNSATTPPQPPREGPAVNVLDLVLVLIESMLRFRRRSVWPRHYGCCTRISSIASRSRRGLSCGVLLEDVERPRSRAAR